MSCDAFAIEWQDSSALRYRDHVMMFTLCCALLMPLLLQSAIASHPQRHKKDTLSIFTDRCLSDIWNNMPVQTSETDSTVTYGVEHPNLDSVLKFYLDTLTSMYYRSHDCRLLSFRCDILSYASVDEVSIRDAVSCDSNSASIKYFADLCFQRKEYDSAVVFYYRYMNRYPKADMHYIFLIQSLMKLHRYDSALKICSKSIAKGTDYSYLSSAQCSNYLYRHQAALTDVLKYIASFRQERDGFRFSYNDAMSQYEKAVAKCGLKKYHEAIIDVSKWLEEATDNRLLLLFDIRAIAKLKMGDLAGAIEDCNVIIGSYESDPHNAFCTRAMAKMEMNDYSAAIQDFNEAIRNYSEHGRSLFFSKGVGPKASSYMKRGLCHYYLNEYEQACLDWSKAGELGEKEAYQWIHKYCNPNLMKEFDPAND